MSTTVLKISGVKKDYQQGKLPVPALRGVNLEIAAGEFVAIAGPSGSGKTTLLNMIGCLDQPTEGSIVLDGRDITRLSPQDLAATRREAIGFVFQSFNLIPVLTAYENVELPLALLRRYSAGETRERVMAVLAEVGLEGLEGRRPADLSGGQQQRVAVARALVKQPKFVLADEPTANLDSENGEAVLQLMLALNRSKGTTFIFSTHDPRVMARARRLVTLRDGRVTEDSGAEPQGTNQSESSRSVPDERRG